jgi:hypothetical protein
MIVEAVVELAAAVREFVPGPGQRPGAGWSWVIGGTGSQECAVMSAMTVPASPLSAYRPELGSFSWTHHTPYRERGLVRARKDPRQDRGNG